MSKDLAQRRFISIPFSFGCRSHSSVDVARHAAEKPQASELGTATGKGESLVARLLRGFKSLSQIFAVYDEDDDEKEEREMVIGLPTDVKHVAHIGWDGSTNTTTSVRSWNRAAPPPPASTASISTAAPQQQEQHPLPLPPLSMRQFELAMAAQAAGGAGATPGSSSTSTASHRRHS